MSPLTPMPPPGGPATPPGWTPLDPPLELGALAVSRAVAGWMDDGSLNPALLIARHRIGDWGDVDAGDWAANDHGARDGQDRIVSSYGQGTPRHVWIITEIDRSRTTILRPEDY
jgi:hypothetical protein